MKKKNLSKLIYLGLVLGAILFVFFFLRWNSILSAREVAFTSISMTDDHLELEGALASSAKKVSDYTYKIKGDAIILTLYGSLFKGNNEDIHLRIEDDFSKVHTLILKDKREEISIYKR